MNKRIIPEYNPKIVKRIRDIFEDAKIEKVDVSYITIDSYLEDVDIDIEVFIDLLGPGVEVFSGHLQLGVDDDSPLAEAIREYLELEEGND